MHGDMTTALALTYFLAYSLLSDTALAQDGRTSKREENNKVLISNQITNPNTQNTHKQYNSHTLLGNRQEKEKVI